MEFTKINNIDDLKNTNITFFKMDTVLEPDRSLLQDLCIEISSHTPDAKPGKELDEKNENRTNPFVGAVLVRKTDSISYEIYGACRSALHNGEHGECGLLTHILGDLVVDDSEMYVSLEPCTQDSRHEWTEPCCEIIKNRRIRKVNIGMLDPNPDVAGNGIRYLIENGIEVQFFDWEKQQKVIKQNEEFSKQFKDGRDPRINKKINNAIKNYISTSAIIAFMHFNKDELKVDCNESEIENIKHSFNDMMIKNKSIFDSKSQFLPFDVTDEFAMFFFKKPFHYVDAATICYVDATKDTGTNENIETSDDFCNMPFAFTFESYFEDHGEEFSYKEGSEVGFIEKIAKVYIKSCANNDDKKDLNLKAKKFLSDVFGEKSSYLEVIREAFLNALIHRDYINNKTFTRVTFYSDKITIQNPIAEGISELEKLKAEYQKKSVPSRIVNPKLMRFFMLSGLCERKNNGFNSFRKCPWISFELDDELILTTTINIKIKK